MRKFINLFGETKKRLETRVVAKDLIIEHLRELTGGEKNCFPVKRRPSKRDTIHERHTKLFTTEEYVVVDSPHNARATRFPANMTKISSNNTSSKSSDVLDKEHDVADTSTTDSAREINNNDNGCIDPGNSNASEPGEPPKPLPFAGPLQGLPECSEEMEQEEANEQSTSRPSVRQKVSSLLSLVTLLEDTRSMNEMGIFKGSHLEDVVHISPQTLTKGIESIKQIIRVLQEGGDGAAGFDTSKLRAVIETLTDMFKGYNGTMCGDSSFEDACKDLCGVEPDVKEAAATTTDEESSDRIPLGRHDDEEELMLEDPTRVNVMKVFGKEFRTLMNFVEPFKVIKRTLELKIAIRDVEIERLQGKVLTKRRRSSWFCG